MTQYGYGGALPSGFRPKNGWFGYLLGQYMAPSIYNALDPEARAKKEQEEADRKYKEWQREEARKKAEREAETHKANLANAAMRRQINQQGFEQNQRANPILLEGLQLTNDIRAFEKSKAMLEQHYREEDRADQKKLLQLQIAEADYKLKNAQKRLNEIQLNPVTTVYNPETKTYSGVFMDDKGGFVTKGLPGIPTAMLGKGSGKNAGGLNYKTMEDRSKRMDRLKNSLYLKAGYVPGEKGAYIDPETQLPVTADVVQKIDADTFNIMVASENKIKESLQKGVNLPFETATQMVLQEAWAANNKRKQNAAAAEQDRQNIINRAAAYTPQPGNIGSAPAMVRDPQPQAWERPRIVNENVSPLAQIQNHKLRYSRALSALAANPNALKPAEISPELWLQAKNYLSNLPQ